MDDFDDYAFTLLPMRFVTRPPEEVGDALGATMGRSVTDRFNIQPGSAAECVNQTR